MGNKTKKRSKGEEERRLTLLEPLLNKFCYTKMNFGHGDFYAYVYHRLSDDNSTSKLEQIILSGNLFFDGLYGISDYEIDRVWDVRQKKYITELFPKRYDMFVGEIGDEIITETQQKLMEYLVDAKYLTETEFWFYCQNSRFIPENMDEIRLIFEKKKKKKKEDETK